MSDSIENIESSKLPGIYLKDQQHHLGEDHVSRKMYSLKNSRRV